jgi:hypothetical protein
MSEEILLSVPELARAKWFPFSSQATIRKKITNRELPAIKFGERKLMIYKEDAIKFIDKIRHEI